MLGGSGFLGNALYRELLPYFNTHATYYTDNATFESNFKFHQWDLESEDVSILLEQVKPNVIISALRGSFDAQVHQHLSIINYILKNPCKLIFLSSANVFDAFTNYPSYEYDKTLSESVYGRFKIKIENALLRLPNNKYNICRLPMVFGAKSPRLIELTEHYKNNVPFEVFPNVVINATTHKKLTQQLHYIINRNRKGVFHLGSKDLVHHDDLIQDICKELKFENPLLKSVYNSNEDRYLAVMPKDNLLPKNLQMTIQEVIKDSVIIS
ncbi:sugar nucleotide-binding protein [Croceibacter atlanticus]|uniref:sugar nucleotide-binding protein n=1 Tax=Croceibacter atlanticus TaxID=313588 RepID=UPI002E10E49E|nr:sugar nucleotide-binding protein [Croceibacter atlanticus]